MEARQAGVDMPSMLALANDIPEKSWKLTIRQMVLDSYSVDIVSTKYLKEYAIREFSNIYIMRCENAK